MNVLIIGSGAREHAFCWKLKDSANIEKIYVAPGNAGTLKVAENLDIDILNFNELKNSIIEHSVDLVIIGPEIPLIEGIVDFINNEPELNTVLVVGPSKAGAMLEGSKDFSKEFMFKHNIPTAKYKSFNQTTLDKGLDYLDSVPAPYVLKADGPAAGSSLYFHITFNTPTPLPFLYTTVFVPFVFKEMSESPLTIERLPSPSSFIFTAV